MSVGGATVVLAHGLGGSGDLPVPYMYAMVGAAWALTFTFALVAFAWRRPRFDPLTPGRPLPAAVTTLVDARATRWTAAGLALPGFCMACCARIGVASATVAARARTIGRMRLLPAKV